MTRNFIFFIIFLKILAYSGAQQSKPLKLKSRTTADGHVYPPKIDIATGEDALFQLLTLPANFDECSLTSPKLDKVYSIKPGNKKDRIQYWNPSSLSTGCGVRIKRITLADKGKWKLKARNKQNKVFQSLVDLNVLERNQTAPVIYLREGDPVDTTIVQDAKYCDIKKLSIIREDTLYNDCKIKLDTVSKALAGVWSINAGMKGQTKEVKLKAQVVISKEEFLVGINYTLPSINLYCNLHNTKDIVFQYCRFVRSDGKVALNLNEGLSDGKYSYYGNGLKYGDCGLTIESPSSADLNVWKCHIGFIANKVLTSKESVIYIPRDRHKRTIGHNKDSRESESNNTKVFGAIGKPLTLLCQSEYRLKYCWFRHPNGTFFDTDRLHAGGNLISAGILDVGECGITIINTSSNDTGEWTCHMSAYDYVGMDLANKLDVRITETELAAYENKIKVKENDKITIKCQVISSLKNLEYCRFALPGGTGFSLNENITEKMALEDLYWYSGRGLNEGDCQVTINEISSKHIGTWICAAKFEHSDAIKLYDYIKIQLENQATNSDDLSITSIAGIVVGAIVVLVVFGGVCFGVKLSRRSKAKKRSAASRHSALDTNEVIRQTDGEFNVHSEPNNQEETENIELDIFDILDAQDRPSTSRTTALE